MKITRIRDAVAKIPSPMRNAVISFDKMTISFVAIETDVIRDGKPVIGYGFCSNGRYAQSGVIRERLAPRILEADRPESASEPPSMNSRIRIGTPRQLSAPWI